MPVSFPYLRAIGQLVVYPPSRIVSRPKGNNRSSVVGTLQSENPYPGIHSVPSYVAVCDVAQYLSLSLSLSLSRWEVQREILPLLRMKSKGISHTSLVLRYYVEGYYKVAKRCLRFDRSTQIPQKCNTKMIIISLNVKCSIFDIFTT